MVGCDNRDACYKARRMKRKVLSGPKAISVSGTAYYAGADVARAVGVSRQTLWRWRREGKVPTGRRFRDRQILFTAPEVKAIKAYASRLEPAAPSLG